MVFERMKGGLEAREADSEGVTLPHTPRTEAGHIFDSICCVVLLKMIYMKLLFVPWPVFWRNYGNHFDFWSV
jgi:hypothetical protein